MWESNLNMSSSNPFSRAKQAHWPHCSFFLLKYPSTVWQNVNLLSFAKIPSAGVKAKCEKFARYKRGGSPMGQKSYAGFEHSLIGLSMKK